MKRLRAYQQDAVQAAWNVWRSGGRDALIVMASGLGKRVVAAHLGRKWWTEVTDRRHGKILFMMHMREGLVQAREEFEETFRKLGISTGLLTGWEADNLDADVLFTTFQSMDNILPDMYRRRFGLLFVDEAHHGQAPTYRQVIEHFQPRLRVGLTATPERMDGLDIRDLFGEPVYDYPLVKALQDDRWLARVDYRVMNSNISRKAIAELTERLEKGDRTVGLKDLDRWLFLKEKLDEEVRVIRREQKKGDKQCIIFCRSHHHVREVCARYPDAEPYHTNLSQGTMKARFEAFRHGEIRTLVAVDKLNEAIDIPDAELIVFLRTTCSKRVWLQQLGRGLRKIPGKDAVVVLDFVADSRRLLDITSISERTLSRPTRESFELITGWTVKFTQEIVDIVELIQRLTVSFYPTWEEASAAAQVLGTKTLREYKRRYKEDPRLQSDPDTVYADIWKEKGGWRGFLTGIKPPGFYPTWEEASAAARALAIKGSQMYANEFRRDPRLPSTPGQVYAAVWDMKGGWPGFLGTDTPRHRKTSSFYASWEEASTATRALKIRSSTEYERGGRFHGDPFLPPRPYKTYADVWDMKGGWPGFLGTDTPRHRKTYHPSYPTLEESSAAARVLSIRSRKEYRRRFREDPRLPYCPERTFSDVWEKKGGWRGFLTGMEVVEKYASWEESSAASRVLAIQSGGEYSRRYKEDPRLPSNPWEIYKPVWKEKGRWSGFLKTRAPIRRKRSECYPTWDEASVVARSLGITTTREYQQRYDEDPRLPGSPQYHYSDVWETKGGWPGFLGTNTPRKRLASERYPTWEEASAAARALGIKSVEEYHRRYKEDPRLPSGPHQIYADVWKKNGGWPGFLGKK